MRCRTTAMPAAGQPSSCRGHACVSWPIGPGVLLLRRSQRASRRSRWPARPLQGMILLRAPNAQPPATRATSRLRPQPPMRNGPAAPASPCSSCSTTRKAARTRVLHGDAGSRAVPVRDVQPAGFPDRHLSMEGIYEYGSRAGVWRILREFERRGLPLTVFGVEHGAAALPRRHRRVHGTGPRDRLPRLALDPLPEHATRRPSASTCGIGMEIIERADRRAAAGLVHRPRQPEHAPAGGRLRRLRVRQRLLRRRPAVLDAGAQERRRVAPHLVVPYTLDTNDMRFALPQGFAHGERLLRLPARQPSTRSTPKATDARRRC